MKKIIILIFSLFIFSLTVFSQVNDEIDSSSRQIPYDEVYVAFILDGSPALEEVGFDNPKSSWKFTYELRFLNDINIDFELQKKIYAKYENQGERTKWASKANKLIAKEIKKMSILIAKGRIKKSSLLSKNNREIIMPIKLTRQIQEIIAASAGSNQNPEFIINVKGKVFAKTTSKLKFKESYSIAFPCPVKIQSSDRKIYWSLNRCGVSTEVVNENNKIRIGMLSRL